MALDAEAERIAFFVVHAHLTPDQARALTVREMSAIVKVVQNKNQN